MLCLNEFTFIPNLTERQKRLSQEPVIVNHAAPLCKVRMKDWTIYLRSVTASFDLECYMLMSLKGLDNLKDIIGTGISAGT